MKTLLHSESINFVNWNTVEDATIAQFAETLKHCHQKSDLFVSDCFIEKIAVSGGREFTTFVIEICSKGKPCAGEPLDKIVGKNKAMGVLFFKRDECDCTKFDSIRGFSYCYIHFLRTARYKECEFMKECCRFFDNIYFAKELHKEIKNFANKFETVRDALVNIFITVNDEWEKLWNKYSKDHKMLEKAVKAKTKKIYGLSRDQKLTAGEKRARTVTIDGKDYYCEWHFKIEGHQDRVYFCPFEKMPNSKILIGIFHKHL
jgi:hypothetical protein